MNYLRFPAIAILLAGLAMAPIQGHAGSTQDGRDLYQRHCVMCHGMDGNSSMANAPSFKRGEGLFKSDFALLEHLQKGKNACPSYLGVMRDREMYAVIAYIRTLFP